MIKKFNPLSPMKKLIYLPLVLISFALHSEQHTLDESTSIKEPVHGEEASHGQKEDKQFAPDGFAGHQSVFKGVIKDANNKRYESRNYYLDSSRVIINDLSEGDPSWRAEEYSYEKVDHDSGILTIFELGGTTTINIDYSYTEYSDNGEHVDHGTVEFSHQHPQGGVIFSKGEGEWSCQHLDISEVPSEFIPQDYSPRPTHGEEASHAEDSLPGEDLREKENFAPRTLVGLKVEIHDIEIMPDGSKIDYGKSIKTFSETEVSGYADDTKQIESDQYEYSIKEGNTALITISHASNDSTAVNLTFSSPTYAEGTWLERDDSGSYEGTTTFNILTEESEQESQSIEAPDSIAGYIISYYENGTKESANFSSDGKVYGDKEDEWTYYTYEKISSSLAEVTYTFENEPNPEPEVETLTFSSPKGGTYSWVEYTDPTKTVEKDTSSGEFILLIDDKMEESGTPYPDGEKEGEGPNPGEEVRPEEGDGMGDMPPSHTKNLPIKEVEEFVLAFTSSIPELQNVRPVIAEKSMDAFMGAEKFIYVIGMDNGFSLYFDKDENFIHASFSDPFAPVELEYLELSEAPQELESLITTMDLNAVILDIEKEFSVLSSQVDNFVYSIAFESNGTSYITYATSEFKLIQTSVDDMAGFEEEWKPVALPKSIHEYLMQNYPELVENETDYFADQRMMPDGTDKEFFAVLEDGSEIIFDSSGKFLEEFNPWEQFEQNLDAGLKFDRKRSSDLAGINVHISKVLSEESEEGSLLYRICLTNKEIMEGEQPKASDLDISGSLATGQPVNLTFTYEVGPPRYLLLGGSNVTAFKHRMPEWDEPGSFTIKAESVKPVQSASNPGSVTSSLGLIVEMGGERFYNSAIFQTNVVALDLMASTYSSPWDPVAGFMVNGTPGVETSVKAYLPRRLLNENFGIMDPNEMQVAIVSEDGNMSFLDDFSWKPHKGYQPSPEEMGSYPGSEGLTDSEMSEFLLEDKDLGITEAADLLGQNNPEVLESSVSGNMVSFAQRRSSHSDPISSKFDFDGDQFANSLLEVSVSSDQFPAEIQFGSPYEDPFANVDFSQFGSVSGTVTDKDGNPLNDFFVEFFKVSAGMDQPASEPPPGRGPEENFEPVFFDFEMGENGQFTAKLPQGKYNAQAFAYDPETDTAYKPKFATDESGQRIFEISGSDSVFENVDFSLEAEFRMDFRFVRITGNVSKSGGGEISDVFFDLFPLDESGQRATDYPVHGFSAGRDGKIRGEVPVGKFEIEVMTPDNSLYSQDTLVIDVSGESDEFDAGEILLAERSMVTISGKISDDQGKPVWADILFVNPNDLEEEYWPMWNEMDGPMEEGQYSVKIPEGTYLIKAERFDGLFNSEYYDAEGDGQPDQVEVISGFSEQINFQLTPKPSATVTVKLIDSNNSSPIKYAWFDFFDAEDEFGPTIFPGVEIDFEASDFDGTYTLSVPGGSYKLALAADGYMQVFKTVDESGNEVFSSGTWEDGASLHLVDGNTTDLGTVKLQGFTIDESELYGFEWMDEDDQTGGFSIKGKVKTNKGTAVPKATIIAHTDDYLFWFDHVVSRSDGSYELKNLPEGNWLIFAEPPYDSESFRGFRESAAVQVSLAGEPTDATPAMADLTLQGSNVSGRVLFPKKDRTTGESKNNSLSDAFIWAFQDEDSDGEPDYDPGLEFEDFSINEAFGETDDDGFFSFYLQEAGKYSLRIELPGELSALSPPPIPFSLKNPNDDLQLGNAIKIDWKSDYKATAFDIRRKSSTESAYKSLFGADSNSTGGPSKPDSRAKSFVDSTILNGETYVYEVYAETANGQIKLDSKKVRVSKPIIFLAPPSKTISGRVVEGNSTISGAEVVAWREEGEGWSSTFTGDDGSYELVAGPGKWEVTIYRPMDTKVDWVYDNPPMRVSFKAGSAKENKSINFNVNRMKGGKIIGSIAIPAGKRASDLAQYVFVDAFDPEGRGNWSNPDSTGKFEIPLQPGEYELSIWVDPQLKGIGSPPFSIVRVGTGTIDVGEISLTTRNQTVSGKVATDKGKFLANIEVWAWSDEGGWVSDVTNTKGEYTLAVSPGRWEIGYDLPEPEDGSDLPYIIEPPKRLMIKPQETSKKMNFTVKEAGLSIKGVVNGPNGSPVTDLDAWVYAREYTDINKEDEFEEIIAEVPLSSRGEFSFPGIPGTYSLGLWLPPGSSYDYPQEKIYVVEDQSGQPVLKDLQGNLVSKAGFDLKANDSKVEGSFTLNKSAVTGLTGEVYAVRLDGEGWQSTPIEDNGTFSLLLSSGSWAMDYFIESDASDRNIPSYPSEPTTIKTIQSSTTKVDFALSTASASISGTVRYDGNLSAVLNSTLFVWTFREDSEYRGEYWKEVEIDSNGTFTIPVLPGGEYEVGAILSQELRQSGYLDSQIILADLSSGNVVDLNLTISKPSETNFISGTVSGPSGNLLSEAYVYAWADDGREVYSQTDSDGAFKILAPKGSVWHVGAEYSEIDDNGTETFLSTKLEMDVNLKSTDSKSDLALNLSAPGFKIPHGNSVTFDPSVDFVTKLPDGTELTIPGGAANVASTEKSVRIVITPTAKGLSKSSTEKPADYGYSVELFDSKGKKVEGNFKKDVILTIPVDLNASLSKGMDVNNIEAKYYSTTKDAWDKAKTSTWDKNTSTLTMTTDHFTTFAAVSTPDISDISIGLAKIDDGTKGDWYSLDWLGYFYDSAAGWIYHVELGWLYVVKAENGNYWFYDNELGWLWTGPSYFDSSKKDKSFLYSVSESNWLYFTFSNGLPKFYSYLNKDWITSD